jgi:hypothetical protein
MSIPASDLISSQSAALRSVRSRPVRESWGERPRRVMRASRDRERRVRAEARWRRFVYVCRCEFLRRDADPGRGM